MPREIPVVKKKLTKKQVILISVIAVVVCAAVVTTILLLRNTETIQPNKVASGPMVVDKSNLKNIQGDVSSTVAEGMFATYMNTTWVFPDGKEPSNNAVMGNDASNKYPFWFTVKLADTGEIVYTSSLLPVGTQIDKIVLDKDLAKGTYKSVVNIHMENDKNEEVQSNMGFNITLVVNK